MTLKSVGQHYTGNYKWSLKLSLTFSGTSLGPSATLSFPEIDHFAQIAIKVMVGPLCFVNGAFAWHHFRPLSHCHHIQLCFRCQIVNRIFALEDEPDELC